MRLMPISAQSSGIQIADVSSYYFILRLVSALAITLCDRLAAHQMKPLLPWPSKNQIESKIIRGGFAMMSPMTMTVALSR